MKPTLSDIAREANVSVSTVSQALRGKGTVAKETKDRILRVARELGYNRKTSKDELRIGVIAQTSSFTESEVYKQYFAGIKHELGDALHLVATVESDLFPIDTITNGFADLDGIIFFGGEEEHPSIKHIIDQTDLKIIMINRYTDNERISTVCTNNFEAYYEVTTHLIKHHCYKNFAFACQEPIKSWARKRFQGHQTAVERHLEEGQTVLLSAPRRKEIVKLLLELDSWPDALLAESDGVACYIMESIQSQGIKVPEDIAIVGCDDLPVSRNSTPRLSTINTSPRRLGETAARLLKEVIYNGYCSTHITIPARPIYRGSCGCSDGAD